MKESSDYLNKQKIRYKGSKLRLLPFIEEGVRYVGERLGKKKMVIFDGFSGSGIVSRFMKQYASHLITNDLEDYARVLNNCYLRNRSSVDMEGLERRIQTLRARIEKDDLDEGFISELYSPVDHTACQPHERMFYTRHNAQSLDTVCQYTHRLADDDLKPLLLAPLMYQAARCANTCGHFASFLSEKPARQFFLKINLELPILSNFECDVTVYRQDTGVLARDLKGLDLAYLDPPYNETSYGRYYFMLNLIADYQCPSEISNVAGVPRDRNKSSYNDKRKALYALQYLIDKLDARYILISFSDDGYIRKDQMLFYLKAYGKIHVLNQRHKSYNTGNRKKGDHVTEYLYILEKG